MTIHASNDQEHPQPSQRMLERVADFDDSDADPFERDDYADECGDIDAQHLPRLESSESEWEADQQEPVAESDSSDDDPTEVFAGAWGDAEQFCNVKPIARRTKLAARPVRPDSVATTTAGSRASCARAKSDKASGSFRGPIEGQVFTTRNGFTGNFPDRTSAAPTPIFLAALTAEVPPLTTPPERTKRASRPRGPGGRRLRVSKRAHLTVDVAGYEPLTTGLSVLTDRTWRDRGLWTVDTSNPNSWASAENTVLVKSEADAILVQETKRYGDVGTLITAARGLGWSAAASPAKRVGDVHGSGGCAVATRRGNGIRPHPNEIIKDGFAHRAKFAWVAGFVPGVIHMGSVDLIDSVGLAPENLEVLQEVAIALKQLKGPWILGGDWNVTPQVLAASNWVTIIGGVIVAPAVPTCNGSTYDFVVVDKRLQTAIA